MSNGARNSELKVLGHYRGYAIELRLAAPEDRPSPGTDAADLHPDLAAAVEQFKNKIDRHIEYQRIAAQFDQGFLQPMVSQGFSNAKILDAIADFALQANWPEEVVKNLEYAAAALQDSSPAPAPAPGQRPLPPP